MRRYVTREAPESYRGYCWLQETFDKIVLRANPATRLCLLKCSDYYVLVRWTIELRRKAFLSSSIDRKSRATDLRQPRLVPRHRNLDDVMKSVRAHCRVQNGHQRRATCRFDWSLSAPHHRAGRPVSTPTAAPAAVAHPVGG